MKKTKSLIAKTFAIFLSITVLNSCSNQDTSTNSNLLENLSKYNQSHLINSGSTSKGCEGFWDCLGSVCAVAGADIVGAGTGIVVVKEAAAVLGATTGGTGGVILIAGAGVVCGAGASYSAHAALTQTPTVIVNNHRYGNLSINLPTQFSYLSNVGRDHNTVINDNFFNNQPITDYYKTLNLNPEQIKIMESKVMKDAIAKVNLGASNYVKNHFDYRTYTQTMVDEKLFTPNMKAVMDLFLEKYLTCTQDKEIEEIVNYYIAETTKSNLTELEKQALLSSFMVASQSPYYFLNN